MIPSPRPIYPSAPTAFSRSAHPTLTKEARQPGSVHDVSLSSQIIHAHNSNNPKIPEPQCTESETLTRNAKERPSNAEPIPLSSTLPVSPKQVSAATSPNPRSPSALPAVGTASEDFYARTLAPWRAAARRRVMKHLQSESVLLAQMQARVRHPWLDAYFLYTSSLGTHTFFMAALPALFFFGCQEFGRGLVFVLGMGVYVTSFAKDLVCSPRPYTPPVTRLTIGSHHLEYGFPSTHSTNSVSIALYLYSWIHTKYFTESALSSYTYSTVIIILIVYVFSIVFGRLYTGMHSFTDCTMGCALGVIIWGIQQLWWKSLEASVVGAPLSSYTGPITVAILCGLMVHWHPQPADDCPCFEDAIAFVSVIAGMLISEWGAVRAGYEDSALVSRMAGHPFSVSLPFLSFAAGDVAPHPYAWRAAVAWWGMALLKLSLGISLIFAWRLLAKSFLHAALPPLFRALATRVVPRLVRANMLPAGASLPSRRFYTPATEYDGRVPEGAGGLRPIPSVMDLPAALHLVGANKPEYDDESGKVIGIVRRRWKTRTRAEALGNANDAEANSTLDLHYPGGGLFPGDDEKTVIGGKLRYSSYSDTMVNGVDEFDYDEIAFDAATGGELKENDLDESAVRHYDADVLTKVAVYSGIGTLASEIIPIMFELLGWGVHP